VGIADADSAAAPTIGLLIALFYVAVFTEIRPFKNPDDNTLAIILSFSLVLFFLAALMIKVDATGDSAEDRALFDNLLLLVLGSGPFFVVAQHVFSTCSVASFILSFKGTGGSSSSSTSEEVPESATDQADNPLKEAEIELACTPSSFGQVFSSRGENNEESQPVPLPLLFESLHSTLTQLNTLGISSDEIDVNNEAFTLEEWDRTLRFLAVTSGVSKTSEATL
jgi:hypothetical protein